MCFGVSLITQLDQAD